MKIEKIKPIPKYILALIKASLLILSFLSFFVSARALTNCRRKTVISNTHGNRSSRRSCATPYR